MSCADFLEERSSGSNNAQIFQSIAPKEGIRSENSLLISNVPVHLLVPILALLILGMIH